MMAQAGADAIELPFGCPAPYFYGFDYAVTTKPEVVGEVCREVKGAVSIPVGVKVGSHPPAIARAAFAAGADWVTIRGGGIPAAPGINLDTVEPRAPYVFAIAGLPSQRYALFHALNLLRDISPKLHISATGGIVEWRHIAELVLYGASSIEAQSVFLMKGYGAIARMKEGLVDYMGKKGFASLTEMRGAILSKLPAYDDVLASYAHTKGLTVARVNEALCNNCGLCEKVCGYGAIRIENGLALIDGELCEGCGLCGADCPTDAISLENPSILK
jgi:dihydropyrimidine dehydrogenase (NAD+) subunit PreA